MKKNLIGIVAAGLALALAFTGCESGSDSPVKYATDLDNPVTKGSKFTYTASPTEWTYTAAKDTSGTGNDETRSEDGILVSYKTVSSVKTTVSYTTDRFDGGVQNFSKKTGVWGKVDKTAPVEGDVINTKSETIVLDSKDNTFSYETASSAYEVRALSELKSTATDLEQTYTDYLPYQTTVSTETAFAAATSKPASGAAISAYTVGTYAAKFAVAKPALEAAIAYAKDNVALSTKAFDALAPSEQKAQNDSKTGTEYTNKKADADALDKLNSWLALGEYYEEGARFSILSTDTKNGATTGSLVYYTSLGSDKKVVKTVSKAGGTAKAKATGSYKFVSGAYKDGTILITKYVAGDDTIEFDDDNNLYVKNGVRYAGQLTTDYPTATLSSATDAKTGSNLQKAARTLSIANKVLTSPAFVNGYLNGTGAVGSLKDYKSFGYLLGSSYVSYKAAKDAHDRAATTAAAGATEITDATKFVQQSSYSYTLPN